MCRTPSIRGGPAVSVVDTTYEHLDFDIRYGPYAITEAFGGEQAGVLNQRKGNSLAIANAHAEGPVRSAATPRALAEGAPQRLRGGVAWALGPTEQLTVRLWIRMLSLREPTDPAVLVYGESGPNHE